MTIDSPPDLERLRSAFAAEGDEAFPCPPADEIFAASQGELGGEELGRVLDHVALCAACTEAWRLAVEIRRQVAPETRPGELIVGDFGRRSRLRQWIGVIAALLFLALAYRFFKPNVALPDDPVMRGADEVRVIDATVKLERTKCVLRWRLEPAQPDARFDVVVMNEDLESLANATALEETFLEIPAERLAALPAEAQILWRVEASLPDGQRVASPTFTSRLP